MIIPGMEVWTMDEERVGARLRGMWRRRYREYGIYGTRS